MRKLLAGCYFTSPFTGPLVTFTLNIYEYLRKKKRKLFLLLKVTKNIL